MSAQDPEKHPAVKAAEELLDAILNEPPGTPIDLSRFSLPIKCPHCAGKEPPGCAFCVGGQAQAGLAEGDWYTRACTSPSCGFENGVRISKTLPKDSPGLCVECRAPTEWRLT